ncbi:ArsR/SmtB family transcription factor [Paenibacillus azoreducens]|uniref:HTH arsR-type domain-containing protein n=1 Tax=Paenibacillus azoreducens TaxID=116718 RepID=A0A919YG31_9BACL|nr:ArsR family transcriptional regulator [Paenibacillus azoreducens]GIO51006.1 hypothetical protein J34TS1_57710 [Paenibacillus azoreducens]
MTNNYSISIEQYPAYELIVSLYTFIYNRKLKTIDLKDQWVKETKGNLPPHLICKLEDERWEVLHRIVLLISQCSEKETVDAFLKWFEGVSAGELYERLAPWVDTISTDLGTIRDKTVEILHEWNEYYFKNVKPAIHALLKQDAKDKHGKVGSYQPIDLIEEATNGLRIEKSDQLNRVVLIPQYHCSPVTILDFFNGIATCLYPVRNPSEFDPTKEMISALQCLGDETRLKMLLYVAEQPRTLIDLHKHFGLAKSTIHHHIAHLRREGAIRSHFMGSSTPAFYSLRKSFISKFSDDFTKLFENHGEAQV